MARAEPRFADRSYVFYCAAMSRHALNADPILEQAIQAHRAGKLQEAENCYRRILAIQPRNADCLHLLGVIALQTNRNEEAVGMIRKAIAVNARSPAFHNNLGLALRALDRNDEAAECFSRALSLNPGHAGAHTNLGSLLRSQGMLAEALSHYREALAIDPALASAHNNLGVILMQLGQIDEAAVAIDRALALKPDFAEALNMRGNILRKRGRPVEARHCYEQALTSNPDLADAHMNLGIALQEQGRIDEAIARLEHALAMAPGMSEGWRCLAHALAEKGQLSDAVIRYEKALALQPANRETLIGLATALLEGGRTEEARQRAGEAVGVSDGPSVPLGMLLLRCGLQDESRRHLEACLELGEEGAATLLAAMGLREMPERPADQEVRKFYSGLAEGWDEKMRLGQRYFGPALAATAILSLVGTVSKLDILDAGCGTGLLGSLLRHRARRLDGVDLSPEMLEKARAKALYDHLAQADIITYLLDHPESYDVVASIAALIFHRDLQPAFAAAGSALRKGGLFVLTLFPNNDEGKGPPARLQINGTYTHGRGHVAGLAEQAGFHVELMEDHTHEISRGAPVTGLLVGLRKAAVER